MVESAAELADDFPFSHKKVGIVAGASTPHDIIQEVERKMSNVENFAELLEASIKTLNTGDTVTGYVTAVNDSEIQLDVGAKVTGIIKADKITDDPNAKLTEMFKIGDAVEAFVVRVSDVDGFATLDKKRVDSDKNWGKIVAAKENGETLEGTVIEVVKGGVGVIVLVDSTRVFVHASQTGVSKNTDLSTMIGNKVSLPSPKFPTTREQRAPSAFFSARQRSRQRQNSGQISRKASSTRVRLRA
jgi:4-hydroxy-3-methylbut-2-enyl diphosphate reductase